MEQSTFSPYLYKCDPEKNKNCPKTGCKHITKSCDDCDMTSKVEYSTDGKVYLVATKLAFINYEFGITLNRAKEIHENTEIEELRALGG